MKEVAMGDISRHTNGGMDIPQLYVHLKQFRPILVLGGYCSLSLSHSSNHRNSCINDEIVVNEAATLDTIAIFSYLAEMVKDHYWDHLGMQ